MIDCASQIGLWHVAWVKRPWRALSPRRRLQGKHCTDLRAVCMRCIWRTPGYWGNLPCICQTFHLLTSRNVELLLRLTVGEAIQYFLSDAKVWFSGRFDELLGSPIESRIEADTYRRAEATYSQNASFSPVFFLQWLIVSHIFSWEILMITFWELFFVATTSCTLTFDVHQMTGLLLGFL